MEIKKPDFSLDLESSKKIKSRKATSLRYMMDYCGSFVDDESFENKQFDRYVAKVNAFLKEELSFMNPDREQVDDLQKYLLSILASYYRDCDPHDDVDTKDTLCHMIHRYCVRPEVKLWNELGRFSDYCQEERETNVTKSKPTYRINLMDYELREACKEFIRKRAAGNDSINRSTYFATLPKTPEDAVEIMRDILNHAAIDFERTARSAAFESLVQTRNNDTVTTLTNTLGETNAELEETRKRVGELENELKLLRERCERGEKYSDENLSEANDYIAALQRENQKLKTRYEFLLKKYEDAVNNEAELCEAEDAGEDDNLILPELDTTKRYLFVLGEQNKFQSQLSEAFPNSIFTTKIQSISKMDIECVIAITSNVGHSVYFGMKNQCKSQNIPFIHCEHSNVELIKQLLQNTLY